jgi:DNA-binding transcriptional LysR family regulator
MNLKHLRYFWAVATHGSIARASEVLYLTPQTISGQLRELEQQLNAKLFQKSGRNLVLTDTGRVVFSYADEMFRLGDELQDVLAGRTPGAALTLTVGVAMVVPKLLTWAQRLKRVFKIDVERCRVCGGPARVIACIEDPVVIKKILVHLQEKSLTRAALLLPDSRAPPQSGLFG